MSKFLQVSVLVNSILWCAISTNSTTLQSLSYAVEFEEAIDQIGIDDGPNRPTEDERSLICGKVIEEALFDFIKHCEVAAADTPANPILDQFTCPKLPAVHVSVNQGENENKIVTLTAPPKHISSLCAILYKLQRFTQISEIDHLEQSTANFVSATDRFTKGDRFRLCKDAAIVLSHKNIEWLTNVDVGEVKSYELTTKENRDHPESVQAFLCPTRLTILLTVPKLIDGRIYSRILIERTASHSKPSPDRFAPEFRYFVRIASSIVESNSVEDSSKTGKESLLVPAEYNQSERHKICHEASEVVPDSQNLLSWSAVAPGEEEVYEVETENEQGALVPDYVLAFECPTHPPIFPQPYIDRDMKPTIAVYIRETHFLKIAIRRWDYLM